MPDVPIDISVLRIEEGSIMETEQTGKEAIPDQSGVKLTT